MFSFLKTQPDTTTGPIRYAFARFHCDVVLKPEEKNDKLLPSKNDSVNEFLPVETIK